MEQVDADVIQRLLKEKNYLAAYLHLKEVTAAPKERYELLGSMVNAIVEELESTPPKEKKERYLYLRSILIWIFQDVPRLASIYKEQLLFTQTGKDTLLNVLKNIKQLSQLGLNRGDLQQNLKDSVEIAKQSVEELNDGLKSPEVQDGLKELADLAEDGVKQGLKQAADFFTQLADPKKQSSEEKQPPD